MHKCFLTATIFFTLFTLNLFAQHAQLDRCVCDSLFRVKPHESLVQKAKIYLELADLIKNELPQKSFSYIVSAFKISICKKNDSLKAKARMMMGDYQTERRKYMLGNEHYLAARKTYQAIKDTTGEIEALARIGFINRTLNNNDKSLSYLLMGIDLCRGTNTNLVSGMLLEQIGLTYQAKGDIDTAMYYFNKALYLFRKAGGKKNEFHVQNNIGSIYLDQEKYDEALTLFTRLLDKADSSDAESLGILYTRIGHVYYKKNDHRTSLKYNLKALKVRQYNHAPSDIASSLINIAGDYYNLGKQDSGKLYMDSGLIIAQRLNLIYYIGNGYRHLYSYYLRTGDYRRALDWYAKYSSLQNDITLERNKNNMAILETNQKLQGIQESGKIIGKKLDIQSLNLKYHDYQSVFLMILLSIAGFSMLVVVVFLLYVRRVRQKMQELNIKLSEEIREREATEEQISDRENQYKFLTDNSIDFITHMDDQKNRIYASPASMDVYGYEPDEILTKSPYDLTLPEYHDYTESKFREMVETRSSRQFIYQARKKDGTVFWVESILNPLFDPISGVFKGMVGVTRDIQDRKIKEFEIMEGTKQKENLLKEIHHRVKNNFAILVSLINMQMAQTKNPELLQSLTNLQLRIRTMALVHEMLYRSGDFEKISFPGYLRSLASVIAGTYNRRDIDLTIEADEVVMDIEASIPLGLIVNEILSNAYKHAFPDERAGKILLRFTSDPDSGFNTLVLKDDGIGLPNLDNLDQYKTMGLKVVQILCHQIEGKLVVANDPGASFTIRFQVSPR